MAEFLLLFPDTTGQLRKELKCCYGERTKRGILFVTETSLHFYSKMLGKTKLSILMADIQSILLSEPSVEQTISVVVDTTTYKFLSFHQDIEESFDFIQSVYVDYRLANQPSIPLAGDEVNHPDVIETEDKENKPQEDVSSLEAKESIEVVEIPQEVEVPDIIKTSNVVEVAVEATEEHVIPEAQMLKKTPSNSIRERMRKRQALVQKKREESEAKIKEKVTTTRQNKKKPTTGSASSASLDNLIQFGVEFLISFFIMFLFSFIMASNVIIPTWLDLFSVSIVLASLQVVSCTTQVATLAMDQYPPKVKENVSPRYLLIANILCIKFIVLLITCISTELDIHSIIAFFLILLATSSKEIIFSIL